MNDGTGILVYDPSVPKLVVDVDIEIVKLARALLPNAAREQYKPQRYPGHITVVRNEGPLEPPPAKRDITFKYDPEPVLGDVYAWLRVYSADLMALRRSFGLPATSEWSRPPDGEEVFHITIGNRKWMS